MRVDGLVVSGYMPATVWETRFLEFAPASLMEQVA